MSQGWITGRKSPFNLKIPFPAGVVGFLKLVVLETAAAVAADGRPVLAGVVRGVAILLVVGAVVGRLVSVAADLDLPAGVLEVSLQ